MMTKIWEQEIRKSLPYLWHEIMSGDTNYMELTFEEDSFE